MAVVGTGLIGTSVALAARRRGVTVYLSDIDDAAVRTAAALDAGIARIPAEPVELAVLAVPPSRVGRVFAEQRSRGLALSYTDVASVKSGPERAVLAAGAGASCYIGGHPMAGRERSGPLAARADLFRGRPWVLTPSGETDPGTVDRAVALVDLCGAVPVVMRSAAHDRAVALTSHVPHLVATLMAARLLDGPAETARLTGQGLRDVTRIAGGDSGLWSDILRGNAPAVLRILRELHTDLSDLLRAVEDLTAPYERNRDRGLDALVELLDRGVAGLDAIAPDHDTPAAVVEVTIGARGGELARLLDAAAELGVGAERATVDAAPGGRDRLRVRFAVAPPQVEQLLGRLAVGHWSARPGTPGTSAPDSAAGRPGG